MPLHKYHFGRASTNITQRKFMIRFDSIKIPKMERTAEGYLRGEAIVSRAGVFKYRNADGSVRGELRHPDDIFTKDSLDSLRMIPITNDHPPEFVNASNAAKYQIGQTGERYDIDNDQIIVSMTVTHQDAIDAIESGKVELSMGYEVNLKPETGNYQGEHYDARQLTPKYNHLAIVQKGRAGPVARLRFDNAWELALASLNENESFNLNRNNMTEVSANVVDILKAEKSKLEAQLGTLKAKLDLAEEEITITKKELNKEKELKSDEIIATKVMDRVGLITKAKPFLSDRESLLAKTDREIMESVINVLHSDSIDLKEFSNDYVRGVFEASILRDAAKVSMDKNSMTPGDLQQINRDSIKADLHKAMSESLKNNFLNSSEDK